jgi:hypothetical protein
MTDTISEIKSGVTNAIKHFKETPLESIAYLSIFTASAISVVTFLVSLIMMFASNTYAKQIKASHQGLSHMFSATTAHYYFNEFSPIAIAVLLTLSLIVIVIDCIKDVGKVKKVFMIIFSAIFLLSGVAEAVLCEFVNWASYLGSVDQAKLSEHQVKTVVNIYRFATNGKILAACIIVGVLSLIVVFILTIFSDVRPYIVGFIITVLTTYAAVPLLLLIIENIIPLIICVVVALVVFIIIKIVGAMDNSDEKTLKETLNEMNDRLENMERHIIRK